MNKKVKDSKTNSYWYRNKDNNWEKNSLLRDEYNVYLSNRIDGLKNGIQTVITF